ncbi:Chromosome segregation ATPase [Paenibacillus sp. yr247]|uniref:chromosome segregation ATPase n=1 Tax=Paenibacillus sp. yr247 TaxID=1761880 RepID=UPI0008805B87|nr:chromosome segregation ATPase [Paenibacillus sp. yr247]SDP22412.1 Chromosome segregation ATPase [Paenibacillus sp. yr247]
MPTISKIRFTHVIYEGGNKRYNDEIFDFYGHNGAIVLENGGGKTVFIQTALQAVFPHADLAGRKVKETLSLDNGPAHVAIEWILNDKPRRRYAITCVSLFQSGNGIDSLRYVYEYGEHDSNGLDHVPFVKPYLGKSRPADKGEMQDYYTVMEQRHPLNAKASFPSIKEYRAYLEDHFQIITGEWEAIAKINDTEGGIENFFDECKSTTQLFDRLLIPTVEQSIEGYEQGAFAKMFESHREGFKKYKELKEQIEENNRILQELGQYVMLYEKLGHQEQQYEEGRREAKSYWQLSVEHEKELHLAKSRLLSQHEEWSKRKGRLLRQRKSLSIVQERQDKDALETKLQLTQNDLERAEARLGEAERNYFSLQYAEGREKRLQALAKIKQIGQQLERQSYSEDEQILQKRWDLNGGQLRYLFQEKDKKLSGRQAEKETLLKQLAKQLLAMDHKIDQLQEDILEKEKTILTRDTEQRIKRQQLEQIANKILINSHLEKVEIQMPLWAEEEQRLEQSRIALLKELKRLEEERNAKNGRRNDAIEERMKTDRELTKLLEQEERQRMEHDEVKLELVNLRPSWEKRGSLYEKQASIQEQLAEEIEKRLDHKRKLLIKERLAYRYVDDHGQQELFFADVAVSKLCEQWRHQFSLLQLGTVYINDLYDEAGGEIQSSRLWAVTLITTDHEKSILQQKLRQTKGSFAYPIRVLNTQEAANAVQGQLPSDADAEQWVVPEHWLNNEQPARFEQWKSELAEQADEVKVEREKAELDIAKWQSAQRKFAAFLVKFPLTMQQEVEQKRLNQQAKLIELNRELERLENDLINNRLKEEQRRKAVEDMGSHIIQLGMWLQEGRQYMLLANEVNKLEKEIIPVREQLDLLQKQLEREQTMQQQARQENDMLKRDEQDIIMQQRLLQLDERYSEVQSCPPEFSDGTIEELKEERKVLDLERHRIYQERRQLETNLSSEQEREQECSRLMEQLFTEHPDLDTEMPLPIEIEKRKRGGWSSIQDYRNQCQRVTREHTRTVNELQTKNGALQLLMLQFNEQFPAHEPDLFQEALWAVEERLSAEETQLRSEAEQLKQQEMQTDKQLKELEHVVGLWNKHLLVHALEDIKLPISVISEENKVEFRYNRALYTERSIEQLRVRNDRRLEEQKSVQKGRQRLKEYCSTHVKDVKLRQMTIQGVETKDNYGEITDFQKSMEQRIQMAVHLWEQTLQTHDLELQQYIQHINAHLKLIVQELKEIPKKTRVKTGEGWKEIYSFTIPVWEEQDGKQRIRKHIDWIMSKLERYTAEQEQGGWQEQQASIRKDLEKWLDARQLIQVVMNGEGVKVACHKVTNDQQVTKSAFSWEQSNRWSGGEKWSKNMTLFLGLLNYVAERKQFIQAKMKRHRTVILDNPFGKASSDHVLSPVFFIAEQLGFQMIALTAHVEGKFLQDYFPIVYSCRLRHAVDSSKQIIESTQQIQTAYFRDNDPDTLDRIGNRVSQVELF